MVAFQLFRLNGFCVFIKVMIFLERLVVFWRIVSVHFCGDSFMIIWDSGQPTYVYFERVDFVMYREKNMKIYFVHVCFSISMGHTSV